ncbi:helix-turn-helix transcriptional regulator [Longimycelium tulufanense]|uniref:helix-turn-helix transcriptional regulator n=1 Tax=Longimycelium tulufanense TaxID=907463 RepID=UPI003570C1AA
MNRSRDRLLTTAEAAEMLGVEPGTLRQWRYRNEGPVSFKVGRRGSAVLRVRHSGPPRRAEGVHRVWPCHIRERDTPWMVSFTSQ